MKPGHLVETLFAAGVLRSATAFVQSSGTFPAKPVRVIIGVALGGGAEVADTMPYGRRLHKHESAVVT